MPQMIKITGSEEGGQHSLLPCQLIVTSTRDAGNDLCFLGTVLGPKL